MRSRAVDVVEGGTRKVPAEWLLVHPTSGLAQVLLQLLAQSNSDLTRLASSFHPKQNLRQHPLEKNNTHVELCWACEKEANRTRIARNTFPKTSVPFLPILNGAK
jgi:hypothetical protein